MICGRVLDGADHLIGDKRRPNYWVVDAQPHVMSRLRLFFRGAQGIYHECKYTHRPMALAKTIENARDLLWFHERYPFEMPDSTRHEIESLSGKYERMIQDVQKGGTDKVLHRSDVAWQYGYPPYEEQVSFYNILLASHRILLADEIGEGKTESGLMPIIEPEARPALIVCEPHLCDQWQRRLRKFVPAATSHVIKGAIPYQLPPVDVLITAWSRLAPWIDALCEFGPKYLVGDEIQAVRHTGTDKRAAFATISQSKEVVYCTGLSATPIYNFGGEIWSVLDCISPGCLGPRADFLSEWCTNEGNEKWKVKDPVALHSWLKARGLMLRREGKYEPKAKRQVVTLQGDLKGLRDFVDVGRLLALSVLGGKVGEAHVSGQELDWKLRQATGIAKARAVAQFVRSLVDDGRKVLLSGWHREVYRLWMKELWDLAPVLYTGTETPAQKNRTVDAFCEGASKVMVISNRSGAGLDGLQHVCHTCVIGELDWSPHVMNQLIGRVDRNPQQAEVVDVFFPVIEDGSDPVIMKVVGEKIMQHEGIVEGKEAESTVIADNAPGDRIREMAEAYLQLIGEALPDQTPTSGLLAEAEAALRRLSLTFATEADMDNAVASKISEVLPGVDVRRQVWVSKRSRLDFLLERGGEKVAIEDKIDQTGRRSVYEQVRRYIKEIPGLTGVVIYAPWTGVKPFVIDEVPVVIVDWSVAKL